MASQSKEARHWADATAERIVRTRGERDRYVLAAGITASGPVQFGNMREIMTPDAAAELRPPLRGVFEQQMARLGIEPEWISQADMNGRGAYADAQGSGTTRFCVPRW